MIGWRGRDIGWEGVQRCRVVTRRQSVGLCGRYASRHVGGAGWSKVTLRSEGETIDTFKGFIAK